MGSYSKITSECRFLHSAAHFVKSEMSVAVPKSQTKNPIDIDAILVCRKLNSSKLFSIIPPNILSDCVLQTKKGAEELSRLKKPSQNDVKNLLLSELVRRLSLVEDLAAAISFLESQSKTIEKLALQIQKDIVVSKENN